MIQYNPQRIEYEVNQHCIAVMREAETHRLIKAMKINKSLKNKRHHYRYVLANLGSLLVRVGQSLESFKDHPEAIYSPDLKIIK